jgi:hypothetical protein
MALPQSSLHPTGGNNRRALLRIIEIVAGSNFQSPTPSSIPGNACIRRELNASRLARAGLPSDAQGGNAGKQREEVI